jgi:ribonuclease VapC
MIAVDTSALMAIVLDEPQADACIAALGSDDDVLISAGTLVEALVASMRRNVGPDMTNILEQAGLQVVPVTHTDALRAADAYARWGRGSHRAGLNYGDCFAYALAKERSCPLLYIGEDFSKTDIASVL